VISGLGGRAATGLDMGAALQLGAARGSDMEMLGAVLPDVEAALMRRFADGATNDDWPDDKGGEE